MRTSPVWNPEQYGKYADERGRPFADLVARIGAEDPRVVYDLGCGPGNLTITLLDRWPNATVHGIDSSPEMIAEAQRLLTTRDDSTRPAAEGPASERSGSDGLTSEGAESGASTAGRVVFEVGDLREWVVAAESVDVIVTNATLQWIPEQLELLPGFVRALKPGGWLAIQIPGNGDAPSHAILRELAATEPYAQYAADKALRPDVPGPAEYVAALSAQGCSVDAWETTYCHLLQGDNAVLEWVKGTGARPVLQALPDELRERFEQEYGARLAEAYPKRDFGTLLPFRRIFAVARKGAS